MAYSVTNQPYCIFSGFGAGRQVWRYDSTDVHTDVDEVGYFTDGYALGMRVGDLVIVTKTSATIGATLHTVITATAGGAATVSSAILA